MSDGVSLTVAKYMIGYQAARMGYHSDRRRRCGLRCKYSASSGLVKDHDIRRMLLP